MNKLSKILVINGPNLNFLGKSISNVIAATIVRITINSLDIAK